MKKSERNRFHDLARRQADLNDTENAELKALHAKACEPAHNDPAKDVDDVTKPAAEAAAARADGRARELAALPGRFAELEKRISDLGAVRGGANPKADMALAKRLEEIEAALSELGKAYGDASKRLYALENAATAPAAPAAEKK